MSSPTAEQARRFALRVVRKLRAAGHEALWAGGCVRDQLLNLPAKDYDVATSARPEHVRKLFSHTVLVGESFGVVRVIGRGGLAVEVATFREDAEYADGRHPTAVVFSTAQADARRRDFTINGIFYDPLIGAYHDYVGGQEDLQRGIIRAIGDPERRFAEDKLRLLRAIRFAARFDYEIEPATAEAVRSLGPQLSVVSAERILAEMRIMLTPATRCRAVSLLVDYGLFGVVLPELVTTFANEPARQRSMTVLGSWAREISLSLAIAGLLSAQDDVTAAASADAILRRLKSANDERERAVWLVSHRRDFDGAKSRPLSVLKRRLAHPWRDELLNYHEAIVRAESGSTADNDFCRELCSRLGSDEINPPPLLTGDDLIAMGLAPGPQFRDLLESVRDAQLDGLIGTKPEALELVRRRVAAIGSSINAPNAE
jgi:poly(A) polymerase